MYSKEMVLQQSSNNQTIHDRLLSVIKLAISREYMLMDQVIGKTRTFKMTTRGLFVSLEKILSTEVFSERLSRMAESFLESSRVSTDPGRNTELKHSNQNYSEITRPGRTQKINVDSQIDDAVGEEKEKSNQANITDESIKSRINDIDTKVEQEIAIVSQNMHFGSIADETSSLQKNCKRTDSAGSISVQSDTDSPRDSEDHMSKNARMRSDREKRGKCPSAIFKTKFDTILF